MNKYSHINEIMQREISRYKSWQKCKVKTGFRTQVDNELKFTRTFTYVSGNLQVNDNNTTYYFSREIDTYIYKHLITRFMETLEKRVVIEKTTTREFKKRLLDKVVSTIAPLVIDWLDELAKTETQKSAKLIDFVKSIYLAKNDTEGLNKLHKFLVIYCAGDSKKTEGLYNALLSIQQERKETNKQENKAVKAVRDAFDKMCDNGLDTDTAKANLQQMVTFGVLKQTAVDTFLKKLDTDTSTAK